MPKNKCKVPSTVKKTVSALPGVRSNAVITRDVNAYKDSSFSWRIEIDYLCSRKNCCNKCELCFSLYELTNEELFFIFEKLYGYETWTWRDIEKSDNGTSCGFMLVEKLDVCDIVRQHLSLLHFDDEYLYKIEISGRHRIWGIRRGSIFYWLWNDREHRFYKGRNTNYTKQKK
ncbi:MAG: hypothetical protein LBB21_01920 [Holosporaceae bacterium]|jgi:hypothetical protein|nr:hypothetical protein [Holosporaceae bacterium]